MPDPRLKECLDRWPGELPAPICAELDRLQAKKFAMPNYVMASIARICRLQYKSDIGGDHWRTPTETWENKGGDCEDIAILTAAVIKAALPATRIELVLAWKAGTRKGHALICAHGGTEPVYIDNEYRLPYAEAKFSERYEEHSRLGWPA